MKYDFGLSGVRVMCIIRVFDFCIPHGNPASKERRTNLRDGYKYSQ